MSDTVDRQMYCLLPDPLCKILHKQCNASNSDAFDSTRYMILRNLSKDWGSVILEIPSINIHTVCKSAYSNEYNTSNAIYCIKELMITFRKIGSNHVSYFGKFFSKINDDIPIQYLYKTFPPIQPNFKKT